MPSLLLASLVPLVAAAVAQAVLHLILRRSCRTGPVSGRAELRAWVFDGLMRVERALAVLIWAPAIYGTLVVLLPLVLSPSAMVTAQPMLRLARDLVVAAGVIWVAVRSASVLEKILVSIAADTDIGWDDALLAVAGRAVRILLPICAVLMAAQVLPVPAEYRGVIRTATSVILIGAAAYLLYQVIDVLTGLVLARYRIDVRDNLEARAIHTQVRVLRKIAVSALAIVTLGSMLMVFEPVRQFGTSILASAGIAGIVLGLAAQRTIGTLLAGLQIALTQPIRLDDVVIVDGEWGRIEDIALTYATVRIWDERRLIVPITRFIDQPFENWTRRSAEIIGSVFLHVDYRTPLEPLRAEFERILRESRYWDGKVQVLQVTDALEQTMQLRALASAADAGQAWDLRCELREKLLVFLQREYPESLPRMRAELLGTPEWLAPPGSPRPAEYSK